MFVGICVAHVDNILQVPPQYQHRACPDQEISEYHANQVDCWHSLQEFVIAIWLPSMWWESMVISKVGDAGFTNPKNIPRGCL